VAEWRGRTDFDPVIGAGVHDAYVDRSPSCTPFNGALAFTCTLGQSKATFIRVIDADIFINPSIVWNTSTAQDLSRHDFRGVATHEVGHTARLFDLTSCGPAGDEYTMCGSADKAVTFRMRSLESDDVGSANAMY